MDTQELIKQTEERINAIREESKLVANQAAQMAIAPYIARLDELNRMLEQLKLLSATPEPAPMIEPKIS